MGSQVIGEDRIPGRATVGEVTRGRRVSDTAKGRVHRFRDRFERERRASRLLCLSLGDHRRSTSGSGDVSLKIFVNSVKAAKALYLSLIVSSTSADHQFLGLRLMRPKGMEDLVAFSVREVKRRVLYFSGNRVQYQ